MENFTDDLVSACWCSSFNSGLHIFAPGIVLVNGIDAFTQRAGLFHRIDQGGHPHRGRGGKAEMIELALVTGQFHGFPAKVHEQHFITGIAKIVFTHIFGQLSGNGR